MYFCMYGLLGNIRTQFFSVLLFPSPGLSMNLGWVTDPCKAQTDDFTATSISEVSQKTHKGKMRLGCYRTSTWGEVTRQRKMVFIESYTTQNNMF